MKCPVCGNTNSKVIDSRPTDSEIRRRRECLSCGRRFTTYEIHEQVPIVVIKKDGSKQFFDRSKILKGLYFAGEVIDVDAYTGGFNLQIAFSTGHLAGSNI